MCLSPWFCLPKETFSGRRFTERFSPCKKSFLSRWLALTFLSQTEEEGSCVEYVEGLAVLLACLLVGGITAGNNYSKELKFRSIQASFDDHLVKTWRHGEISEVRLNEICVGDVVQLDTGDKIPAGKFLRNVNIMLWIGCAQSIEFLLLLSLTLSVSDKCRITLLPCL